MATTKAYEIGDFGVSLNVNSDGEVVSLDLDSDSVTEGSTNLFYTNTRARGAISVSGNLTYDSSTGVLGFTMPTTIASLSNHDTDDLTEGSSNLYFTTARARSSVSGSTGITYSSSTGAIALTSGIVTAGTYGDASNVAQVTVDTYGRVTSVSEVAIAGVDNVSYTASTGVLTVETSSGTDYSVDLGIGTTDSPTFQTLNLTANLDMGDNDHILLGIGDDLDIYHDASHSYIVNDTGTLFVQADTFKVQNNAGTATRLTVDSSGTTATGTLVYSTLNDGTTDLTATVAELNTLDGYTGSVTELNYLKNLYDTGVTSTEFNILDGVTATAAEINTLDGVTATTSEINTLDGITATTTELNYTDGVTSNIQTQLNAKLASSSYTAADVLSKIKTVDGAGSGLDADTLDGLNSASFLRSDADDSATGNITVSGSTFLHTGSRARLADRIEYKVGSSNTSGAGVANGYQLTHMTDTSAHYIVRLTTLGTSSDTGACYLVWYDESNSQWLGHLVSLYGTGSNHPQLDVQTDGTITVYTSHSLVYSVLYHTEMYDMSEPDSMPHAMGPYYMWSRSNDKLYYNDGEVGIGTANPSAHLHLYENSTQIQLKVQNNNHTGVFEAYGNATVIDSDASNGVFLRQNGTNVLHVDTDNTVGVGSGVNGSVTTFQVHGTEAIKIPSGTNAQRPTVPSGSESYYYGLMRHNTDSGYVETYTENGWTAIASPPAVSGISPTTYNGESGTTITITGTSFDSTATVKFISNGGTEYTAGSVSFTNSTSLTATTPQDFTVAQEPFDIKVINGSGLSSVLEGALDCGGIPNWTTSSGSLGTVLEGDSFSVTVAATDPDSGGTISGYSKTSGSFPPGISINSSTGVISGTCGTISSTTTYSFTLGATDNAGNVATRNFSITANPTNYFGDGSDGAGSY